MFVAHKPISMFAPSVHFVSTVPKDEPPPIPDFIPLPKTKAEVKQQQKYQWIPGERLAIKLAKEAIKQKKKAKKQKKEISPDRKTLRSPELSSNDLDNISASVSRITGLLN